MPWFTKETTYTIFYKGDNLSHDLQGDNFCDFLFALHTKALLERTLLCKERICFLREQILSI